MASDEGLGDIIPVSSEPEREHDATVTRHEEELVPGTTTEQVGSVRLRKHVDTFPVEKVVERRIEHAEMRERVGPDERDSGEIETLDDGSVSIPVFEEELVVTKRLVVRERIIVRKSTVTDEHRVEAELRKERVEVEGDPAVEDVVQETPPTSSETGRADPDLLGGK